MRADLQFENNYVEFEKTPSNYFALCTRSAIQHALVYGLKNYVRVSEAAVQINGSAVETGLLLKFGSISMRCS
jgi:hypothetical protein